MNICLKRSRVSRSGFISFSFEYVCWALVLKEAAVEKSSLLIQDGILATAPLPILPRPAPRRTTLEEQRRKRKALNLPAPLRREDIMTTQPLESEKNETEGIQGEDGMM